MPTPRERDKIIRNLVEAGFQNLKAGEEMFICRRDYAKKGAEEIRGWIALVARWWRERGLKIRYMSIVNMTLNGLI